MEPEALSLLYVRFSIGALVSRIIAVNMESTVGPLTVNHLGQLSAVTISFNLAVGSLVFSQIVKNISSVW